MQLLDVARLYYNRSSNWRMVSLLKLDLLLFRKHKFSMLRQRTAQQQSLLLCHDHNEVDQL